MRRWYPVLVIAAVLISPETALSQRRLPQRIPAEVPPPESFVPPRMDSPWQGGIASLPYNVPVTWQALRSHALGLGGVNEMIAAFQARGYVRRPDLDTAYTHLGRSGVILGFEIPGAPVQERQPVVIVHSQAAYVAELRGWFPVTVVGGMVARDSVVQDSIHVPVLDRSAGSDPMLVIQRVESGGGPLGTEDMGTPFKAYYTMRECAENPVNAIRHFIPTVSEQTASWWYGLCDRVESGILQGMMGGGAIGAAGGSRGMARGIGWGMLGGALSEATGYIIDHPYDH